MCARPSLFVVGVALVPMLLGIFPDTSISDETESFIIAQPFNTPQTPALTPGQGATGNLIDRVPGGGNALTREEIDRATQDAAQRLGRSRTRQIQQMQDRENEQRRQMGIVGRVNDTPVFLLDCDDTNSSVKPGAVEVCNGIDDNCDGDIDEFVQTRIYED
jgi:hypothetical protein